MERLKKMFGEPAAAVGLLQVILVAVLTFKTGLTTEWVAVIMALANAASALYTMIITKTVALSVLVEALKAVVALTAGFGYALTDPQMAQIIGVLAFIVAAWQRTQTGVAINPGFHDEPVGTPVVVTGEVVSSVPDIGTGTSAAGIMNVSGIPHRGMPYPS
jgi:hypothetical protein